MSTAADKQLKAKAVKLSNALRKIYGDTTTALNYSTAFELLVATILSAQCTDERVNMTTPALFKRFPTPQAFAGAELEQIEELIKSTGFYHQKAKSILNCSRALVEKHGGQIPESMEELTALPGVGRKTANLLRAMAMGKPGLIVDTHFKRLAGRLGLTAQTNPDKIEAELAELLPESHWTDFSNALIWHGRRVCNARKPNCAACPVKADCSFGQQQG